MITQDEYYQQVDMAAYREVVAPVLGDKILDVHAHVWARVPPASKVGQYPEFNGQPYPVERLLAAGSLMFPEQTYHALVFGSPDPRPEWTGNDYVAAECRRRTNLYPLYIPDMRASEAEVRRAVREGGYLGFKPYWNLVDWKPRQDDVTIADMLPEPYRRVANDWGLIIMLHIPGSRRLASPANIEGIRQLARQCPQARIIIAHLGRSYMTWSIKGGIAQICDLPNVYFDTSFVQEGLVYKIFFDHVDPAKVMYGTDLPISEVRGRRVCLNGGWVDVSRERLSWTASCAPEHPIPATFMTYEMIRALREGAEEAGLSLSEIKPIFYENGRRLIEGVRHNLRALA